MEPCQTGGQEQTSTLCFAINKNPGHVRLGTAAALFTSDKT